jgi:DNA-binding NarL/FixJ family response regulator
MKQEGKMNDEDLKTLVQETQWVRKLLMLQVLASGYKQKHIAATLGVSPATMSRMMPKGLPPLKGPAED